MRKDQQKGYYFGFSAYSKGKGTKRP
jgi:hypothetical protein